MIPTYRVRRGCTYVGGFLSVDAAQRYIIDVCESIAPDQEYVIEHEASLSTSKA